MNGRIYDPKLGRFLQADPYVQAPKNSQSLNRYSYVLNNPLSYTDPSGFFFAELFDFIVAIAVFAEIPNWATFANLIRTGVALFNSLDKQNGALPNGIVVGSLTSQSQVFKRNGSENDAKDSIEALTDVTTVTIGDTYSDETSGNFTNGASTDAFSYLLASNTESALPAIFDDKKFRLAIERALGKTGRQVRKDDEDGAPGPLGLAIKAKRNGGFDFGKSPNNEPHSHAVDGKQTPIGSGRGIEVIRDATAIVIYRVPHETNRYILENTSHNNEVSRITGVPVIVKGSNTDIWVFTGQGEPIKLDPEVLRK